MRPLPLQYLCCHTNVLPPAAAAGTPFEGGVFRMKLVLGQDFPASPPKGAPPLAPPLLHGVNGLQSLSYCEDLCFCTILFRWTRAGRSLECPC